MAAVYIKRKDKTGKPIRWGVQVYIGPGKYKWFLYDNKLAADAKCAELNATRLMEKVEKEQTTFKSQTLGEIIDAYKLSKYKGCRENTRINYEQSFAFLAGIENPRHLNTAKIINIFSATNLSPNSIKTYIGCILRMLKFAEKIFKVKMDVDLPTIQDTLYIKSDKSKIFLNDADVRDVLNYFVGTHENQRMIIKLMCAYGFRIRELLKMNITEVNQANSTLTILADNEKTGKKRIVPVGQVFMEDILELRDSAAQKFGAKLEEPEALFHDDKTGKRQKYTVFHKRWRKAFVECGLVYKNIHRCRAFAFGLLYKQSGHNLELVKQICGWDSSAYRHYVGDQTLGLGYLHDGLYRLLDDGEMALTHYDIGVLEELAKMVGDGAQNKKDVITKGGVLPDFVHNTLETLYDPAIEALEKCAAYFGKRLALVNKD